MLSWSFVAAALTLIVSAAALPASARAIGVAAASVAGLQLVWGVPLAAPLAIAIAVWALGTRLPRLPPRLRAFALWAAVIAVLARLVWARGAGALPGAGGPATLGLAYLTLKLVQHLVDASAGRAAGIGLPAYLSWVFLLPTWAAGPIERSQEFAAKLAAPPLDWSARVRGAERIVLAIGKKFLLADPLLAWALPMYAHPDTLTASLAWGAMYAYAFGLYLDFAAYSDFAIGVGALAGVRLRENFDHPYLQPNLAALWQHWHMSLTSWLRDFIFIPAARRLLRFSSHPFASQAVAQIATMAACGLWHGLGWNYLVWGLYHGVLLTALAAYRARRGPAPVSAVRRGIATFATFHVFALGLVVFANDLPRALVVLRRLAGG